MRELRKRRALWMQQCPSWYGVHCPYNVLANLVPPIEKMTGAIGVLVCGVRLEKGGGQCKRIGPSQTRSNAESQSVERF
ncbi:hypothetical protein [Caudoviricetes sp.]|nr:hypothetical protein [Caudoviricetes sp.]